MSETDPVEVHRRRTDRNRRYNIAMLAVVLLAAIVIVTTVIIAVTKIDAKASHVDVVVVKIRTTQVHNTSVSSCQERTFDAILKDVRLAFAGDKNAGDYAKAPGGC